jgi:hypothetical protein
LSFHPDWFRGSQRVDHFDVQLFDFRFEVSAVLKLVADSLAQLVGIVVEGRSGHAVGDLGQFRRVDGLRTEMTKLSTTTRWAAVCVAVWAMPAWEDAERRAKSTRSGSITRRIATPIGARD